MAVLLTVAETFPTGAGVSDALAGGGTGVDMGSVVNGSYTPVTSKPANTGRQNLYIRHNATVDPITSFKIFIQQYGVGTGFTYGGAKTAAQDFIDIKAMGAGSGSSKNNNDGLSAGFWMDMQWDVSDANQFDQAGRPTYVKIFGDNTTDGIDLASAFDLHAGALVYNSGGIETVASSPVTGKIGKSGDTVLGTDAHIRTRFYLASAWSDGGYIQWEQVFSYSYTA